MNLEGGCSCGAIRYKLTNSPLPDGLVPRAIHPENALADDRSQSR